MAAVTGTMWDAGLGHLVGQQPELIFTLNAPNAKSGGGLYTTEPVVVVPASNGAFTATLAPTTDMQNRGWYTLSVQWNDGAGNYQRIDFPDWTLEVPTAGGTFSNLFGKPPENTRMVYVSLTPPEEPIRPFSLWLQDNPNDPTDPANTGDLREWRNV